MTFEDIFPFLSPQIVGVCSKYGQNITVWGPEEKERKKEEGEGEEKGRKGKKKGRKGEGGGASGTEVGYSNFIMKNVPKFK